MDNTASVNQGRFIVNDEKVNMDDLANVRKNGIIRAKDVNQIVNEPVIFTGDKTLMAIQYMETNNAKSTGQMLSNQGLTADQLTQETATRFQGVNEESKAKIELVARNIAEIAYKDLYEGFAWMYKHFQDSELEFFLFGREMRVNPSMWKFEHTLVAKVGTGSGDSAQALQTLSGILQLQKQEQMEQTGLSDSKKIYNTYSEIVRRSDLHGVENFFNDPEQPQEQLQAQVEQLTKAVQQMQQALQADDPLSKAERIRAESNMMIKQGELQVKQQDTQQRNALKAQELQFKQALEGAKLSQDQRQFIMSQTQQREQFNQQKVLDLTQMEIDSGQDIPDSLI